MRLFVAVDPGARFRAELSTRLDAWRGRVRVAWVRAENLHLTLRFLGEMPEEALPELESALRTAVAGHGPLTLRPGAVSAFPHLRQPRVLFLQCDSDGALERLAAAVRTATDPLLSAAQRDDQPFRAHLTLARVKQALPADEARLLAGIDLGAWPALGVGEVRLVRSVLRPEGPQYTDQCVIPLPGGGSAAG